MTTIRVSRQAVIENFTVEGYQQLKGEVIWSRNTNEALIVRKCKIDRGFSAIVFPSAIGNRSDNNLIINVQNAIEAGDFNNTSTYETKNNVIVIAANGYGIFHSGGGSHLILDNIILHTNPGSHTFQGIKINLARKSKNKK